MGEKTRFMGRLRFDRREKEEVAKALENAINALRKTQYQTRRDAEGFIGMLVRSLIGYHSAVQFTVDETLKRFLPEGSQNIADFCCGNGSGTAKIAEAHPELEVFGFDVNPMEIRKAQRHADEKAHFNTEDVYAFPADKYPKFDVVTFNRACGKLGDKIFDLAIQQEALLIAGRTCCYHLFPSELPTSADTLTSLYLRFEALLHATMKDLLMRTTGESKQLYKPNEELDVRSKLAQQMGVTTGELEKIAALSVDAKIGAAVIDRNRMMKLMENGYEVHVDQRYHLFVAEKI
ncbi:MAG TPA: class I SAM-dependent methyltransferase [Candidatus Nanoarchaeia archaeon]|nr:class I SAM-dependent methyltransferase [Candidatus Nanoarchaeia archaeon]